jgi:CubicO group peptidase (beta-lactamase class C family)
VNCCAVHPILRSLPDVCDKQIDHNLDDVFPALTLAVIHQGDWVLNGAWGWIDPESRQLPVTPDSLFDLASVTKLFTVTAFLSLVSEGAVGLDNRLIEVIPEFGQNGLRAIDGGQDPHTKHMLPTPDYMRDKMADPAAVTFRHLLTHTSGLAPWRAVYDAAGPPPPPPDEVDPVPREQRWEKGLTAICTYPFVGSPGGAIHYSDLGLMLLGDAISRLHGTPGQLDVAIQQRVLDRLGLQSPTYNPVRNHRDRNHIVPTENDPHWRGRRCWGEVHDENAGGLGGVAGHAGLFATAVDVARLGQAWLEADPRLRISSALIAEAKAEQAVNGLLRRGLGWMLKSPEDSPAGDLFGSDSYGHTGFTGTSLWIDPERALVVACLTNRVYPGRDKPGIHAFRRAIHDLLAEGSDAR